MAQRISRAKTTVTSSGGRFEMPPEAEVTDRLRVVLHVLYLMFNEGYTASSGVDLQRPELAAEAIRLTREVVRRRPEDAEVAGLLALMLLTDAREAPVRMAPRQSHPASEQDRSRWDKAAIEEGSHHHGSSPSGPDRAVSAPGRDRGSARRGAARRGHGLA